MALGAMVVVVARWGARCGAAQPIHVLSYLRWVAHAHKWEERGALFVDLRPVAPLRKRGVSTAYRPRRDLTHMYMYVTAVKGDGP